jgi:hypothetical protein
MKVDGKVLDNDDFFQTVTKEKQIADLQIEDQNRLLFENNSW